GFSRNRYRRRGTPWMSEEDTTPRVLDARRAAARLAPGTGAGADRPPAPARRRRLGVGGVPRLAEAAPARRGAVGVSTRRVVRRLLGVVLLPGGRGRVGGLRAAGAGLGQRAGGVYITAVMWAHPPGTARRTTRGGESTSPGHPWAAGPAVQLMW